METSYEIPRVSDFIRTHNFTRVALQFPDELLKDSMRVVKALRRELDSSVKVYVMADTTYGSCCVDEVGAAHVNAQCVVHYGHTCLSQTSTLPALFIFGKASINTTHCVGNLLEHGQKSRKPILVLFGVEYEHAIQDIKETLTHSSSNIHKSATTSEPLFANVRFSVIKPTEKSRPEDQLGSVETNVFDNSLAKGVDNVYIVGGLSWQLPEGHKMEDYLLFWIGKDNTAFANVVLTFNNCEIVRYDATEDCMRTDLSQQRKILKRRYYLVEKAKDANMIGILVGTLGAVGYLDIIHQLKELVSRAGKKSYTFVMGRPNPAKLANFPECDVFINVSCAETALLDSKEFLAPVITPFEAMLALDRGSQWTGEYLMEFRDLITSTPSVERGHTEEARFSFLQGGYVEDLGAKDDHEEDKDEVQSLVNVTAKALQVRDDDSRSITKSIPKSGAEYFAGRSHHGLEILADSLPEKYLVGRSGKASGYKDEKTEL